jgi:hypothetical protein
MAMEVLLRRSPAPAGGGGPEEGRTRRPRLSAAADSRPTAVQSSLARIGNQARQAEAGRSGLPAPEAFGEPATCRLTLLKASKRGAAPSTWAPAIQPGSSPPTGGRGSSAAPNTTRRRPSIGTSGRHQPVYALDQSEDAPGRGRTR